MDFTPLDTNTLRIPKSLRNQQTGGGFLSKYIKPIGQGLLTMGKQLGGAIGQGVSEGFGVVGKTINQTPGLKQGVGVLNALDYGLGTAAKTTEGLLTKPRETLMNLKYRPGEGLQGYAQRNVTDITPYVSEKVAGTPLGQKMPMLAPLLGLGAGMLTPSPSDALKVGKFASQAGDIAKFSDEATELVKPSMLADKLYHVSDNPNLKIDTNYNPKQGQLGKGFYVTKNPETWQSGQIGNRPYVYEIDNAGLNIAKDYPTRDELINWGSKNGYYTKDVLKKPDGNYVLGMDGKPMKVWQETPKALKLMEYQDPMTGSKMSGLEQEYLKSKGYDGVSASYSPDGEQSVIFNYDKIKIKPKVDPLTSEAKKYSNKNEFLMSQGALATDTSYDDKKAILKSLNSQEDFEQWDSIGDELKSIGINETNMDKVKKMLEDDIKSTDDLMSKEKELTDIWNKAQEKPTDLIQEAKKYKSADEFVKAQAKDFHGTNVRFDKFEKSKLGVSTNAKSAEKGFWFTDNKDVAKGYGEYASEKQVRDILDQIQIEERKGNWSKAEELTRQAEELSAEYADPIIIESKLNLTNPATYDAKGAGFLATDKKINDLIDKAIKDGNDALIIKNLRDSVYSSDIPATHTIVFDEGKVLTKSQLTDIWNKAQGN